MASRVSRTLIEPDEGTRARRERGRQSQAAFRKRQAQFNRDLKNKNHQLTRSIEKVLDCIQGDERSDLLDAVSDMARTAGINSSHEGGQGLEEGDRLANWYTNDLAVGSNGGLNDEFMLPDKPPKLHYNGMRLDPFHYMSISLPPEDIAPYLGAGSNTFASRLFWFMLEHSQGRCENNHEEPMQFHQRIVGHSQAMEGVSLSFAQTMVEARLQHRRTGFVAAEIASAAELDLSMVICTKVQEEYEKKGDNMTQWMSCQGVEEHIQEILGEDTFTRLQGAFLENGHPFVKKEVEKLYCKLYDTFVCFGDGPRWTIDTVNELVFEWIMSAFEATEKRYLAGDFDREPGLCSF
uniref:BZIP domain-containing protein n=1 Tax=Bionectria ochroleuca TaxID=29856 RepID=A0A8H7K4R5_BIOOC